MSRHAKNPKAKRKTLLTKSWSKSLTSTKRLGIVLQLKITPQFDLSFYDVLMNMLGYRELTQIDQIEHQYTNIYKLVKLVS